MKDVLVINTYAGSLLLAAGPRVMASLETAGYGVQLQRANFPELTVYAKRGDWPESMNLNGKTVIAHPPCACFSVQNHKSKGLDDSKFRPTLEAIEYALGNQAETLAIESVKGQRTAAWATFKAAADEYGYHLCHIELNYSAWVPQNRPRLWTIWSRKKLSFQPPSPDGPKLKEVLRSPDKTTMAWQEKLVGDIRQRLVPKYMPEKVWKKYLNGDRGFGRLANIMVKRSEVFEGLSTEEVSSYMGHKFMSRLPRVVDPEGVATTLLFDSCFLYEGELLSLTDYKRIMGFPDDYVLSNGGKNTSLEWLSRGIVPAAGRWILEHV